MKIHIGCGTVLLKDYVNVDLPCQFCFLAQDRPDLVEKYITTNDNYYGRHEGKTIDVLRKGAEVNEYACDRYGSFFFIPTADSTVDEILARSVYEHLSLTEGERALAECRRALRQGGDLRLDVPDHDETMRQFAKTGDDFFIRHLLGPRATKWGYHCVSYNRDSLKNHVTANGFRFIEEEENIHPYPSFCLRFRKW
jgi:SAM-dependent methyltransferase